MGIFFQVEYSLTKCCEGRGSNSTACFVFQAVHSFTCASQCGHSASATTHALSLSLSLSLSTSLIPSHSHTSERTPNTDNQFYFEVLSQLKRHEAEQLRTFRRKTSTTSDPVIPSTTKQNVVQRGKRIYR